MLIGLTGRMGAGKDTVCQRIAAVATGYDVQRFSFADPLKESVAALFDITVGEVESWKNHKGIFATQWGRITAGKETQGWTMREILQRYGTEAHRDVFGDSFWVDQGIKRMKRWYEESTGHGVAVFTDVRFQNEADAIHKAGGRVFEVVGPDGPMDPEAPHASERGVLGLDGEIQNTIRGDHYLSLDAELWPIIWQGPRRTHAEYVALVCDARGGLVTQA